MGGQLAQDWLQEFWQMASGVGVDVANFTCPLYPKDSRAVSTPSNGAARNAAARTLHLHR
jgi:hypothetical protein